VVAEDGASVAQREGEGDRVVAEDGVSVAQREGEGDRVVAEDGAAVIEVQDAVVVVECEEALGAV
jgi:hypothetical protein